MGAIFGGVLLAQPTVTAIQNNFGLIPPGFPNYGIAEASLFIIKGTGLATGFPSPFQSVPLPTTLGGVSVNVTVNGTTVHPPLYYVMAAQIAAVLPSKTPIGTGQLVVTNGRVASAPVPIQVVQSAFGIDTLSGAGEGPAAAFNANTNNSLLGFTNAANPGEYVVLWGSGVGPDPLNTDETIAQSQNNLTNIPIEVDIGGVPGTVTYRGRSQYPGVDQIDVIVPATAPPGCYVSVVVRTGDVVSNFASIPIAASGRTCSDSNTGLTPTQLQTLASRRSITIGNILVSQSTFTSLPVIVGGRTTYSVTTTTGAIGAFVSYTPAQFGATAFGHSPSIGSCDVLTGSTAAAPVNPVQPTYLDAGPAINISGPNGKLSLPFQNGGYEQAGQLLPTFIPSGLFELDNGTGGADIGAFTAQAVLSAPVVWTNQDSVSTVNRSQGQTITWSGGAPGTYLLIEGASVVSASTPTAPVGVFYCAAPVGPQTFTIPAAVLLALPSATVSPGSSLSVSSYSNLQPFTAPGLDVGSILTASVNEVGVTYQ